MVLTCAAPSVSTAVRLSSNLLLEIPMYAALLTGVLAASNAGNGADSIQSRIDTAMTSQASPWERILYAGYQKLGKLFA